MPDDTTWAEEDYVSTANGVAQGSDGGVWWTQDSWFNEAGLNVRARKRGETLFTPVGELGVSEETVADFFQVSLDLVDGGGQPDAARTVEYQAAGPEGGLLGTNQGAMGVWWTNQLGALTDSSGHELELLRLPGESEGERTGMYYKPAMFYSVSADTPYPESSAKFVDFLLNSEEAATIMLTDRGLPANTDVREAILEDLSPTDQKMADFMAEIEGEIVDTPPVPPHGSAELQDIMERINTEVLFERATPDEAATQFIDEVNAAIAK